MLDWMVVKHGRAVHSYHLVIGSLDTVPVTL